MISGVDVGHALLALGVLYLVGFAVVVAVAELVDWTREG